MFSVHGACYHTGYNVWCLSALFICLGCILLLGIGYEWLTYHFFLHEKWRFLTWLFIELDAYAQLAGKSLHIVTLQNTDVLSLATRKAVFAIDDRWSVFFLKIIERCFVKYCSHCMYQGYGKSPSTSVWGKYSDMRIGAFRWLRCRGRNSKLTK